MAFANDNLAVIVTRFTEKG